MIGEPYSNKHAFEDAKAVIRLRDMRVITEDECTHRLNAIRVMLGFPRLDELPVKAGRDGECICNNGFGMNLSCPIHS